MYSSKTVEQAFVVVVRHPSSVLHLPEHVAHGHPGYTLRAQENQVSNLME